MPLPQNANLRNASQPAKNMNSIDDNSYSSNSNMYNPSPNTKGGKVLLSKIDHDSHKVTAVQSNKSIVSNPMNRK